jgi:hypothetical protein
MASVDDDVGLRLLFCEKETGFSLDCLRDIEPPLQLMMKWHGLVFLLSFIDLVAMDDS